jgi:predicted LPLAT superfamily acyltransferase
MAGAEDPEAPPPEDVGVSTEERRRSALACAGQGPAPPAGGATWLSVPERGTVWGIAAVFWLARASGRRAARGLVALVALYYMLVDGRARAASRRWWEVVEGGRPSFRRICGHVLRFAHVAVDRIFILGGRSDLFTITRDGQHHLARLERERRGAILLGAHLGSFEAMRLGAKEDRLSINVVGNFSNARMINEVLDRVSEDNRAQVIHAEPGDVSFMFHIQERLAAGEMVAILGDRVAGAQPSVTVEFFGRPARFPTGPFQLAALLKCPIYLTFGIFREPNRYELSCEPFAERVELPREGRQAALEALVQRYARALEEKARAAPDNWFNFYDFWER